MKTNWYHILLAILLAFIVILIFGCKKETPSVITQPREVKYLYNWNMGGFSSVDSFSLYNNSKLRSTLITGYHEEMKPGDTISIFIHGKETSEGAGVFNFWRDYNGPIVLTTFHAEKGSIKNSFVIK